MLIPGPYIHVGSIMAMCAAGGRSAAIVFAHALSHETIIKLPAGTLLDAPLL